MTVFNAFRKSPPVPAPPIFIGPPSNSDEEYELGWRHASGQGVDRNRVLAYKWLTLAYRHGHDKAGDLRNMIAERMTAEEMSEADRLIRERIVPARVALG